MRVVTPGITGARAVKWVKRISPARQVSCNHSCFDLGSQAHFLLGIRGVRAWVVRARGMR